VDGDLQAFGTYKDAAGHSQAFYWKDGTSHTLPVPGTPTDVEVTAVAEDGGNVYLAGYYTNGAPQACFWTVSAALAITRTDLPAGGSAAQKATAISVASGALFVGGQQQTAGAWGACAWTGSVVAPAFLALASPSGASGAAVLAAVPYQGLALAAGTSAPAGPAQALPAYWAGTGAPGVLATLPASAQSGAVQALYGDASHLYAGGWWDPAATAVPVSPQPFYYQDWSPVDLSGTLGAVSMANGAVQAITGDGTRTWLAGWFGPTASSPVPCTWQLQTGAAQPVPAALKLPAGTGMATAATLNEGVPWFAGYFTLNGVDHPCCWTSNGTFLDMTGSLPAGATSGRASGVCF
jgi:hypothetical protein